MVELVRGAFHPSGEGILKILNLRSDPGSFIHERGIFLVYDLWTHSLCKNVQKKSFIMDKKDNFKKIVSK